MDLGAELRSLVSFLVGGFDYATDESFGVIGNGSWVSQGYLYRMADLPSDKPRPSKDVTNDGGCRCFQSEFPGIRDVGIPVAILRGHRYTGYEGAVLTVIVAQTTSLPHSRQARYLARYTLPPVSSTMSSTISKSPEPQLGHSYSIPGFVKFGG